MPWRRFVKAVFDVVPTRILYYTYKDGLYIIYQLCLCARVFMCVCVRWIENRKFYFRCGREGGLGEEKKLQSFGSSKRRVSDATVRPVCSTCSTYKEVISSGIEFPSRFFFRLPFFVCVHMSGTLFFGSFPK